MHDSYARTDNTRHPPSCGHPAPRPSDRQSGRRLTVITCSLGTAALSGLSCFIAGWLYTALHMSHNIINTPGMDCTPILAVAALTGATGTLIGGLAGGLIGKIENRSQGRRTPPFDPI
ncbi:hypothetical protein GCM10009619_41460 [Williamsia maris]|uniref:Uncharacterized protein n=1 Tax=Williamsia maris TaxID=72806 RepID=A0ABT1HJD5_9NOCA|nr:hypothetical protein [Williamsia maris]